jgi:hypothetical protein
MNSERNEDKGMAARQGGFNSGGAGAEVKEILSRTVRQAGEGMGTVNRP